MKKHTMNPVLAKENGEAYENKFLCASGQKMTCQVRNLLKGTATCSDAELLSIIIGSGFQGKNSLDIAKENAFKLREQSLRILKFGVSDLQKIKGIGLKRAVKISAMFALARRRNESEVILKEKITQSHQAFEIFKSLMGDLPYENSGSCFLTARPAS